MRRAAVLLGLLLALHGGAWPPAAAAATAFDPLIAAAARRHGVEAALVKAVIRCESNFDPQAVSPRGAQGLMQLLPATQALLGLRDPFDAAANLDAGVRYLALLSQTFAGDLPLVVAAYNAGPQAVIDAGYAVPAFAETQRYVACVLAARQQYRREGEPPAAAAAAAASALHVEPPQVVLSGARLTVRLSASHRAAQVGHGTVMLLYPEDAFAMVALHTAAAETVVRLAPASAPAAYHLLVGHWTAWEPGERRRVLLSLTPPRRATLLHLSVLLYDAARTAVQARWSTLLPLPAATKAWPAAAE
ncbi:MAG: hypothetical protein KatS3mg131_2069 [Candidatus Tectimicrobiota bacterium]|nr:MAG: hypothetical protein KatS3mg131_2069 [Candidatus Tectomicrobia bacterium]